MRLKHALTRMGSGGTPDTANDHYWSEGGGVPWVAIGDMSGKDTVYSTAKSLTSLGRDSKSLDLWPRGTLILSMYASLGHVAELAIDACLNQALLALVPKDGINGKYLKRWFEHLQPRLKEEASSNTQDNLNAEKVRNLPLLVPPLGDQIAIVSFLDRETSKIDALVAEQERLIALLKEKRQAVIFHAVTKGLDPDAPMKPSSIEWLGDVPAHWDIRRITSISTKITNGFVGPTRDILRESGIRYLQSLHIKGNRISFDEPYFVDKKWSNDHSRSILQTGDVLVVQTGDIGQVAVVTPEFSGCNCHALIVISPDRIVLSGEWLSWVLNSPYGFNSLLSIQTGALHPHLNCGNVKDLVIPIPPLDEQRKVVTHLESRLREFDNLVTEAHRAVDLLKERRAALISAAVTGQIDVRNAA